MVKKFLSLLLSCIYLAPNSNSTDGLNSINDLFNINKNINTNLISNVKLDNTLDLKQNVSQSTNEETTCFEEEYNVNQDKNNINQKNSNEEHNNSDDIQCNIIEENNTTSNTIEQNTTKKKKKKHRKKKNKNKNNINQNSINKNNKNKDNKNNIKEDENIYECNEKKSLDDPFLQSIKNKLNINDINENTVQDAKDCLTKEFQQISEKNKQAGIEYVDQTIQDVFNIDIVKSTIDAMNNDINEQIHSKKFKMLGNLHQQIMSDLDNGNTIYNRFNIDSNILGRYKSYYNQLLNCTGDFCNKKLFDIISLDYNGRAEKIQNIITNIYKELKEDENLTDIDDIIIFFIEDKIDSEKDLQHNNVFKIIANLATAINDCTANAQMACLKLAFGPKLVVGNNVILDNSNFIETLRQFDTISKIFGFNVK